MVKPQFEPPLEPRRVGSPRTTVLVLLGLLLIAGVCVLVFVLVVQKTTTQIAPGIKEGWQDITRVRERDAALTVAQKEAGARYLSNLVLEMKSRPIRLTDAGYQVGLYGTIRNAGDKEVLNAAAAVIFPAAEGEAPADARSVLLFDATPLSPLPDKPLSGGEIREFSLTVEGVNARWDTRFLTARLEEARVDVDLDEVRLDSTDFALDSTARAR
jgi:hypothetical protein